MIVGEFGIGKIIFVYVINNYLNEDKVEVCWIEVNCGMDISVENVCDLSRKFEY